MKKRLWIKRGLRFAAFGILFVALASLAVMGLWNALLPALFAVPVIGFGQALGLLVLARLLFGGRGGGWGGWRGGPRGHGWRGGADPEHWRERMEERWKTLSPEQREQMRQRWESRCGPRGPWRREEPRSEAQPPASPL